MSVYVHGNHVAETFRRWYLDSAYEKVPPKWEVGKVYQALDADSARCTWKCRYVDPDDGAAYLRGIRDKGEASGGSGLGKSASDRAFYVEEGDEKRKSSD